MGVGPYEPSEAIIARRSLDLDRTGIYPHLPNIYDGPKRSRARENVHVADEQSYFREATERRATDGSQQVLPFPGFETQSTSPMFAVFISPVAIASTVCDQPSAQGPQKDEDGT